MRVDSTPSIEIREYFRSEVLAPGEWKNALEALDEMGYKVQRVSLRRRYDPSFPLGVNIKLFPDEDKEGGDALGDVDVLLHLEGEYQIAEEV